MGVLSRLFGRRLETRSEAGTFNLIDGGNPFFDAGELGAGAAARSATALACITVISSSLASLTPRLYREDAAGNRIEVSNGSYARLLRRPNRFQGWGELVQTLMAGVLTWGNGLLEITSGPDGIPAELTVIPWPGVSVIRLASGDIAYDVPAEGGKTRRLLADSVVHVRDLAEGNGLVGTPRMSRCPDVLRAALGAQTYAVQVFDHGSTPTGVVTLPPNITAPGMARAEAAFNGKYTGNRRVVFTDTGSTFTPLNITPENSQTLESRKFSCEEVARVYGVPAIMVGINDHSTMTNSETSGRFFAQHCLAPWATRIEQALTYGLLGEDGGYAVELDMTALQRGSDVERWQCWAIALDKGVLSPADVRAAENWSGPPPTRPLPAVDA